MVGSEGTLAFISEVTMNTAAEKALRRHRLWFISTATEACRRAVVAMRKEAPILRFRELLDKKSLAWVALSKRRPSG